MKPNISLFFFEAEKPKKDWLNSLSGTEPSSYLLSKYAYDPHGDVVNILKSCFENQMSYVFDNNLYILFDLHNDYEEFCDNIKAVFKDMTTYPEKIALDKDKKKELEVILLIYKALLTCDLKKTPFFVLGLDNKK